MRRKSIDILTKNNALFVQGGLGFGVYDFIASLKNSVKGKEAKCLRVDCSEVITKTQVDNQVMSNTGQPLAQLIFLLNTNEEAVHFIIFDKIRGNTDAETLLYLLSLPNMSNVIQQNVFFIFTSSVDLKQFHEISVQLELLSLHDTQLILCDKFGSTHLSSTQISQIYERSEGVIDKLEQIMDYLTISSVDEVLSQDDIFDDVFHSEYIPSTTLKQIGILISEPEKALTLRMLNILSVLKNGETLSNLKKDEMGAKLHPRNTQELVQLELASTVIIDSSTVLIKINPIIKDYILNRMTREEIAKISNAYLKVTIIETQNGVRLSAINRKIYHTGYSTEEDNTATLLRYAIQDCLLCIERNDLLTESNEMNYRRMDKLIYLTSSYVYILQNSSRFAETISAINNLIDVIEKVDSKRLYKYYEYIASAHRIKSNYKEAERYLSLCEKHCPASDKRTLESIYIERLYLLEKTDTNAAIALAKANKHTYHKKSVAYILSDVILAKAKNSDSQFEDLVKLERRARRLGHTTTANNILFKINNKRKNVEKLSYLDVALKSEKNAYNYCRATIYKHQVLIESGLFERIKDSDVVQLLNIYNYLFRQKFDSLFNKCHWVLWSMAENMQRQDIIYLIFFKGTIVWRLNKDHENEKKYNSLFKEIVHPPLLEGVNSLLLE
ncbi:TPA: hypothetical protein ACX6O5_003143 [Photobacterium damselae]